MPKGGQVGQHDRRAVAGPPRPVSCPRATCSRRPSAAPTPVTRQRSRCCSRCIRWLPAADRSSCSALRAARRTPASSGAWLRCTGRWPQTIGDALHLSAPVRRIEQDDDGVTVRSDDMTVTARHVIVAVPIAIASQILYEPMLPVNRAFLASTNAERRDIQDQHRLRRAVLAIERPVRTIRAPGTPAPVTIDACTDSGYAGRALRDHRGADRTDACPRSTRGAAAG